MLQHAAGREALEAIKKAQDAKAKKSNTAEQQKELKKKEKREKQEMLYMFAHSKEQQQSTSQPATGKFDSLDLDRPPEDVKATIPLVQHALGDAKMRAEIAAKRKEKKDAAEAIAQVREIIQAERGRAELAGLMGKPKEEESCCRCTLF